MGKIYYNAPCGLFHGFLDTEYSYKEILDKVVDFTVYKEYRSQNGITDEGKRWRTTCNNMGCIIDNKEKCLQEGKKIYDDRNSKEAFFSLPAETFWDFFENHKTEEEKTLLLAYLALKSICGNRQYTKTNRKMWLSRMDGYNGGRKARLTKGIAKYDSIYGARKLRMLLWQYYKVAFYTDNVRGFYFSITLSMEDLARTVKGGITELRSLTQEYKKAKATAKIAAQNKEKNEDDSLNFKATLTPH